MLAFARVAITRLARDRTNVFFMLLFPVLLVLLIGIQFSGGGSVRLAVSDGDGDGAVAAAVLAGLAAADLDLELVEIADPAAARAAVEDGDVDAAVLLPSGDPDPLGDDAVEVAFVANPGGGEIAVRTVVASVVADVDGRLRAERALLASGAADDARTAAELVAAHARSGPTVTTASVGEPGLTAEFEDLGQFDLGASTQLLVFVFITSITGSAAVVQARRWGVLERVLAGPTSPGAVIAGLGLGQLLVAATQAVVIVGATTLLFGVDWGDPLASTAVVLVFCLVAASAGLLLGAVLRNEEQAGGVGVPLGLGLAAAGGCMVPLELFPDALRTVANAIPHTWANLAFAEIVRRDGTLLDVLPQLGVLLVFAVVLGGAAAGLLRRTLATG